MSDNTPGDIKIQADWSLLFKKKVQNAMQNARQKLWLMRDSLYNVHVRAFHFNFVKSLLSFQT